MASKNNVFVMEINGEFRVRPAVHATEGKNGDTHFKIRNLTDYRVVVVLSDKLVEAADTTLTLDPKGGARDNNKAKFLLPGEILSGAHSYSVFVLKDGKAIPAVGESDPIVIVDPN